MDPYLGFDQLSHQEDIFSSSKPINQTFADTSSHIPELRIKRRKIKHIRNFGRGANHPSFFLRKFFSKLSHQRYQKIYKDNSQILDRILKRANQLKEKKNRFNLDDLVATFGAEGSEEQKLESYLNSKVFYWAVSELSLELIMEESKCSQVLNHMISIQKYSARLGNPKLTGRVEFQ